MKAQVMVAIVLIATVSVGIAVGATISREGSGGLWSTVNQWDPNQLPTSSDTALHGMDANDVMTFDDNVPPPARTIGAFTAIAGNGRGLVIDENLDMTVLGDFTRTSGSGAYVTELVGDSMLDVNGAIVQGNWIVNADATVFAGAISLSADTDWDVTGLVDVDGDISWVEPDPDEPSGFAVNDGGELLVGGSAFFEGFLVDTGGSADITGSLDVNDIVAVSGTLHAASAGTTGTAPCLGFFLISDGGTVTIDGGARRVG